MRLSLEIRSGLLFIGLSLLLVSCYQTAGSSVIPTVADLTATNVPPPVQPTIASNTLAPVVNQTSPTAVPPTLPRSNPTIAQAVATSTVPPVNVVTSASVPNQQEASPSQTPFVTAISTEGFLTPAGGVVITAVGTSGVVNPLTPAVIPPTVLLLSTPTAFATEGACSHTVQPGDHVYSIARQYKVSVDELLAANPSLQSNPDQLQIGQTLAIPNCAQPTVTPAVPSAVNASGSSATPAGPTLYAVVKGDTLLAIAHKFNTTVAKLEQANGLNDSSILHIGQQLIIPPS